MLFLLTLQNYVQQTEALGIISFSVQDIDELEESHNINIDLLIVP